MLGKSEQVGVRRAGSRLAPIWPDFGVRTRKGVRKKLMNLSQGFQHAAQNIRCLLNRHPTRCAPHRNTHKSQLRDCGREKFGSTGFFLPGNPAHRAVVIQMIRPAPRNKHIDVQKAVHKPQGKLVSISRVASTVSGGTCFPASKISAHVNGQERVRITAAGDRSGAVACRRRNSESVRRSCFARPGIIRASSELILNEMVCMGYYRNTAQTIWREGSPNMLYRDAVSHLSTRNLLPVE